MTSPADDKEVKSMNELSLDKYYTNSHAIIIGISRYEQESFLPNAINDARDVKRVLEEKCGFNSANIVTLSDSEATSNRIRRILDVNLQDYSTIQRKDRVLLYYSGHGRIRILFDSDGHEVKIGYIIPFDSNRKTYDKSIKMKEIIEACQTCNAKHILLVLDCCYSGFAVTRSGEPELPKKYADKNYLENITKRRAIQVLAATQEDEPASDSGVLPGHSAFTGALLDILENERDPIPNGVITAGEIGIVLQDEVLKREGTVKQMPSYNAIQGSHGGDFIFKLLAKSDDLETKPIISGKKAKAKPTDKLSSRLKRVIIIAVCNCRFNHCECYHS